MVEKARRVRDDPDGEDRSGAPTWEVFVADEPTASPRHVGSVVAATAAEAHERASRLFGWYAEAVWLCPADEVVRYAARTGEDGDAADEDGDDAADSSSDADAAADGGEADPPEPRVYEETEGTPRVRESR